MAAIKGSLKIEIRESIKLNDNSFDSYNSQILRDITDVSKRIVTVPITEQELVATSSTIGSGTFVTGDIRYVRITNLSDEWPILLTLKNSDNDEFLYKLDKKATFLYSGETDISGNISGSGVARSFDSDNAALPNTDSMVDLTNITAFASASADAITSGSLGEGSGIVEANVELFVATT